MLYFGQTSERVRFDSSSRPGSLGDPLTDAESERRPDEARAKVSEGEH